MKDAYYFPHDANARNDTKITAMRSVYGAEGYGWFWMIVEILREQTSYTMPVDDYFCSSLAMQLHEDEAKIKNFLDDCVNKFHLFVVQDNNFFSNSLCRRMAVFDQRKEQARNAILTRWYGSNTDVLRLNNGSNTSKVNKSKVNKSKVNKKNIYAEKKIFGQFKNVLLTDDEYKKLEGTFNSRLSVIIESFSEVLESKGLKYKSDYATILNWERRGYFNGNNGINPVRQNAGPGAGESKKNNGESYREWSGARILGPPTK